MALARMFVWVVNFDQMVLLGTHLNVMKNSLTLLFVPNKCLELHWTAGL